MYDSETGEVVAESELVGVFLDTDTRSATPLPSTVQERADELRVGDGDRYPSGAGSPPEELTTIT